MGRKGGPRHLKRKHAPVFWPIHVKEFQWITKPNSGPHPMEESLPLALVLREMLHYAKTTREAKMILSERKVKVDGKVRRDRKFPVGLMDVVEIPDAKLAFRVIPFQGKGLFLADIPYAEKSFKLCRIEDKTYVSGGNIQLNLHDGRNILIKVNDPKNPKEDVYKTRDTLQITVPNQDILGHLEFKKDFYVLVTAGRNIGKSGKIIKIDESRFEKPSIVTIEDGEGKTFETIADYVFVVGEKEPKLKLAE